MKSFHNKIGSVILLLSILFFSFSVLLNIKLPGINFDEVLPATGTLQLFGKDASSFCCSSDITIMHRHFPLMSNYFHANPEAYLLMPFFMVFGPNVYGLRIAALFSGLLTILFAYLFARHFFNDKVALISTLLLSTNPYFIFASRIGNYIHFFITLCAISSLWYFFRWYEKKQNIYFCLAMCILGLGANIAWFYNVLIAYAVIGLFFYSGIKKRFEEMLLHPKVIYGIMGVFSYCIGNSLFLYANFLNQSTRFITFNYALRHLSQTSCNENNFNLLHNMIARFHNLLELLRENDIFKPPFIIQTNGFDIFHSVFASHLSLAIFWAALAWLICSAVFRSRPYFSKKKIAVFVLFCVMLFLASPFSLSGFFSWHLITLVPFIPLLAAVGMIEFIQIFKRRMLRIAAIGVVSVLIILLVMHRITMFRNNESALKATGGLGSWSSAIYDVYDWLKANGQPRVLALSGDLAPALFFLSQGKISVTLLPCQGSETECMKVKVKELFDKNNNFVGINNLQWQPDVNKEYNFKLILSEIGWTIVGKKMFYSKNGMPVYNVYLITKSSF
jgi:4-amino-4-deoxy-L-arabinose transferase-like glycosyltransferase